MRSILIISLFLLFYPIVNINAETGIPDIVINGLGEYRSNGPEAAIMAWLKDSPMEGDKQAIGTANIFRQIENLYGSYVGYSLIKIADISETSKRIYLQMNYQKGPLYCKFLCYQFGDKWIISGQFFFDTDPEKILPDRLLS